MSRAQSTILQPSVIKILAMQTKTKSYGAFTSDLCRMKGWQLH